MQEEISRANFKFLMSTMYLYAHIWNVFHILDAVMVTDMKVTREEFLAAKGKINGLELDKYIANLDTVSSEEWMDQFSNVDHNNDGFIAFEELCKYAVTKLEIVPLEFLKGEDCEIPVIHEEPLHFDSISEVVTREKAAALAAAIKEARESSTINQVPKGPSSLSRVAIKEVRDSVHDVVAATESSIDHTSHTSPSSPTSTSSASSVSSPLSPSSPSSDNGEVIVDIRGAMTPV